MGRVLFTTRRTIRRPSTPLYTVNRDPTRAYTESTYPTLTTSNKIIDFFGKPRHYDSSKGQEDHEGGWRPLDLNFRFLWLWGKWRSANFTAVSQELGRWLEPDGICEGERGLRLLNLLLIIWGCRSDRGLLIANNCQTPPPIWHDQAITISIFWYELCWWANAPTYLTNALFSLLLLTANIQLSRVKCTIMTTRQALHTWIIDPYYEN